MTDQSAENQAPATSDHEPSALMSRLRLIEDQPIADRAEALTHVHDELRARLESGDTPRAHA
ncbi:MAG: hypothetical protein ACTHMQ_08195 [Protaetiibacter sp.]